MRTKIVLFLLAVAACKSSGGFSSGDDATDPNAGNGNGASSSSGAGGTASSSGGDGTSSSGASSGSTTSGSGGTTAAPKVDVSTEAVMAAGLARSYVLAKPKSFDPAKKYRVVLVFHGDGGNAAVIRGDTHWDDYTGEDALVVYPESRPNETGWDLYTPGDTNVDEAFAFAIVDDLVARFSADRSRVFGWGFSSGAFIINQLACRKTGFFRAIAPNSGGAPAEPQDPNASTWDQPYYVKCAGQTGGVAAFVVHGNADDTVDVESGNFDAQYWSHVNGCNDDRDARLPTPPVPCAKAPSCPVGMDVYYCEIPNMGHAIWSDGAKASWAFFQSL